MDCRECSCDPTLKARWGCEEPTQYAVWATEEDEFYSCPLLWVTQIISDWYEEYAYYQEFTGAAPDINTLTQSWLDAMHAYKSYSSEFIELMHANKNQGSTDTGLSVLRQSFASRGK
jgi:hypothetical protein